MMRSIPALPRAFPKSWRTVSVVWGLSLLVGCMHASGPVPLAPHGQGGAAAEKPWQEVLREHTRRDEVFNWTDRQVDMRATLVTPRLRQAFRQHRSHFHGRIARDIQMDLVSLGQPPDEGPDAPIQTRPQAEEQVIIYLAFYASQLAHRDLAASYGIWDVRLVRGESKALPLSIEQTRYSPAVKAVFPHADRFDEIYILRFPMTDRNTGKPFLSSGGEPLELHVESALAQAAVSWSLAM